MLVTGRSVSVEAIPAIKKVVYLRERKGEPVAAAKARSRLEQVRTTIRWMVD